MNKAATFIFTLLCTYLVIAGTAFAYEHRALVIVDEQLGGQASVTQDMLVNLLGHFDLPYDVKVLDSYSAGDLEQYRVTFYIGSVWDRELPPAFMADVITTDNRFVWINHNIWKLEWSQYEAQFQARYGFTFIETMATGSYDHVSYQGRSFWRPQGEFGKTQILDSGKAATVAAITGGAGSLPYIIKSGNFYYVADNPMALATEESDYLVFADVLHDMVGIDHAEDHKALVRIEDIDPTEDPARIRAIADYLFSEGVPFSLAVIPRYEDPLGARGVPASLGMADRPELVSALAYAVSKGGTVVLHGYTHQYQNVANPYNGVTGLDSEFYIQQLDGGGNAINVSPVPGDSIAWVNGRIDSAVAELNNVGIDTPVIWETPHYLASDLDNRVFADRFGVVYQRFSDFFFPYVIRNSSYGSRVIPENLGYLRPGVSEPALLVERADRNLVIRDGFASFFYHSELDLSYLQTTVAGMKAEGYTFVSAASLVAAEPRDTTPPAISNISPSGTIYVADATIELSYSDQGAGIDMVPLTVTLDGAPMDHCVVGATSLSCNVSGMVAGTHTIGGLVADNAGNASVINSSFLVGDNTPPQLTYLWPDGFLDTDAITVTATYSDPGLSMGIDGSSAVVRLNGGTPFTCTAVGGAIACPLTGLDDGSYSSVVTISDHAGNSSSASGFFIIDTTAPVVASPSPAGWVNATDPTITAMVLEANLHQYPAWLSLDGNAPVACAVNGTVVSCPVSGLSQGMHGYRIDVYDSVLNQGFTSGQFTVDSEAPLVTINSPQGLIESTDVVIEAGLEDSGSGVDPASVQVQLDGEPLACTVSASDISCAADGLHNGDHSLQVHVVDAVGNSRWHQGGFQTLFCTGESPSLELVVGGAYWASYADYQRQLLAVDYIISNNSGPDASNVTLAASYNSNGVTLAGASLDRFGVPAGERAYVVLRYKIPQGVNSFRTATFASATDDCGNRFEYPDKQFE